MAPPSWSSGKRRRPTSPARAEPPCCVVVVAVVVVAGIVIALFGWDRYRGNRKAAGDGGAAQPTAEVFVDPETGRRMRVWYHRDTGRREYRPEEPSMQRRGRVLAVGRNRSSGPPARSASRRRRPPTRRPRPGPGGALVPPATGRRRGHERGDQGDRPDQAFRRDRGRGGPVLLGGRGADRRLPRSQRGGQDDDDARAARARAPDRGQRDDRGPTLRRARASGANGGGAARRRRSASGAFGTQPPARARPGGRGGARTRR